MKKLLVLSLVLGIASLATAGWSFAPDTIGGDGATTLLGDYLNVDSFYVIAAETAVTVELGADAPDASGLVVADAKANGVSGIEEGFNGDVYTIGSFSTIEDIVGGAMFEVSGAAPGQVIIAYFVDGGNFAATEIARTIPEPATMALLGLGALVLRRKK